MLSSGRSSRLPSRQGRITSAARFATLASVIPEEEDLVDQVILIPEEKEDRRLPPRWYMANMVRHAKRQPSQSTSEAQTGGSKNENMWARISLGNIPLVLAKIELVPKWLRRRMGNTVKQKVTCGQML